MKATVFHKFKKFILYADIANKFLFAKTNDAYENKNTSIYIKYIFSQNKSFNYVSLKALMMLSSLYSKRVSMQSKLILLRFTQTRNESVVFLKVNLNEFFALFSYFTKRPIKVKQSLITGTISQKYFLFPGFAKYMKIPSWKQNLLISYNTKQSYFFYFYKHAFLE